MKAIVYDTYGPPDVLELREVDKPVLTDDGVLVRVHASSVNPAEWHFVTGTPYLARMQFGLRKPKSGRVGTDFAGTVEAVGKDVTQFQPGDEVFGGKAGAFAEYVCVAEGGAVVPKPADVTFEQAAAVPIAGLTALQGLRDKGRIKPGYKVLINGASGGVGTFAVQIAKSFGAEVTGVCSTRNVDMVRSIGADHVVDYTQEDFTQRGLRYDLILDNVGNRSWSEYRRALGDEAILVAIGGSKTNRWLGPLGALAAMWVASLLGGQKMAFFVAKFNKPDLVVLRDLLQDGKVTPVIDRTYPLSETAEALTYLGNGHARGKVALSVGSGALHVT